MTNTPRFSLFFLAFSLCVPGVAGGQDIDQPEPEAPTTIFSTRLGDADVDFTLEGTWDAAASFATGLLFVPGLPTQVLDTFPSMEMGFYFNQVPDLTASILLLRKYFMNLSYIQNPTTPGSTQGYLSFGYRGESPDVLRSVLFGNGLVSIPPSSFLEIPEQPAASLGASALLVSDISTHEFLLRWDSTGEKSKTFLGSSEILEEIVPLDGYIRGRFFFLPDTGIEAQSITVYIEDPQGSITSLPPQTASYRPATIEDVSIDPAAGLVSLKAAVKGRVLVYYTKGGAPVGDSSLGIKALPGQNGLTRELSTSIDFNFALASYLGQDMLHRQVPIVGVGTCLLLWEPGDNSPFEIDASYSFTDTPPSEPSRIRIQLGSKEANGIPEEARAIAFQSLPDQKRFVAYAGPDMRGDFRNMYPFPDPDGLIYGPRKDSLYGYLGYEIYVQLLSPTGEFILEPNIVAGSVRVTVNGITETRFEVDPASGKVTFLTDISPADRIEIRYRVSTAGLSGGDILFTWRDTINFSDALKLSLAAGVRWNADPASYSARPFSKSGTILAQAGLEGRGENWSYSVQASAAYTDPDTSGILRLFGMEGNSLDVDMQEDNAYPAAPPDPRESPQAPSGLTQLNRGFLYYKDFRTYDALGGASLNPLTWPGAPGSSYPSAVGERMGPYNVLGSSAGPDTGKSLVFDFVIPSGGWVGAQLLPVEGGAADLSAAKAVTLQYESVDVSGAFQLYIQIGSLSEDIDGDGTLQAESSPTDAGFPFVDTAHGVSLKVGGGPQGEGNERLDSEDRDGNGILDREEPLGVVTLALSDSAVGSDTQWSSVTLPLDDSQRSKLSHARQIRILIVEAGGSEASGKILVDALSFEGAAEYGAETPPSTPTPGSVSVREITESLSENDPGSGRRLSDVYPRSMSLFHPNGEPQQVLEAIWGTPNPLSNPLVISGYAIQGTGGIQYDAVVLYILVARVQPGASMIFSLLDSSGLGVSWSIDPILLPVGEWHEMRVSRTGGKVLIDGIDLGYFSPRFDPGYGSLSKLTVTVTGSSGAFSIDEIQCQSPQGSIGAAITAEATYKYPGVILEAQGVPLLADFSIHQKASLILPGFSTLYGIPSQSEDIFSRTELGIEALFTRWNIDFLLREYGGSFTASGGHKITVPSVSFPVSLSDAFTLTWLGEFSRENLLEIRPFSGLALLIDSKADGTAGILNQTWEGGFSFSPVSPLSMGAELELFQALSGYPLESLWYGARWAREMELVLPWPGGDEEARREKLDIDLGLKPSPFGFEASCEALVKSANFRSDARDQENDLDLSLKLLLHLGSSDADDLSVSLGYRRYLSLITSPAAGERFLSEARSFGALLVTQGYLLTGIPFLELFKDNSSTVLPLWTDASRATYSPRATLTVQRSYGSRLIDLLLPTSVDLTIGQDVEKDENLSSTEIFILPKLTSHALNLFGQLGAYPLFSFVRTDEYGISLGSSFTSGLGQEFRWTEIVADVFFSFQGFSEQVVTLIQTVKAQQDDALTVEETTQLVFNWVTRRSGGFPIPLIPADVSGTAFLSHKESAECVVRYASEGSFHPITVTIGHETAIVFKKFGSIRAKLNLGFDQEGLGNGGYAYRIGVQAELEAKLSF